MKKRLETFKKLFTEFFESEKTGGLLLVFVTIVSLVLSNSEVQNEYINFWHKGTPDIIHWINDGLMTVFFLLIGLELEREIYTGELSNFKNASLPIFGALGGMLIPAGIFLFLNFNSSTQSGFGIPMATDIAFAIGILSLMGDKVPKSLKIFLTAFAVIDDLGAIIVIALFYSQSLVLTNLFISLAIFGVLVILNRLNVYNLIPYLVGGVLMWYFMLHSGVHATITGVLLAFAIPFKGKGEKSPSFIVQHFLHKPVAFIILPLFALANTAIKLNGNFVESLTEPYVLGITLGLVFGKPLGIWLFSFLGVKSGLCLLPADLKWRDIFGAGILGGVGFTMSIFITLRAFENDQIINNAKMSILIASVIAGTIGLIFLKMILKKRVENEEVENQDAD